MRALSQAPGAISRLVPAAMGGLFAGCVALSDACKYGAPAPGRLVGAEGQEMRGPDGRSSVAVMACVPTRSMLTLVVKTRGAQPDASD
jgi:hypothetical protein